MSGRTNNIQSYAREIADIEIIYQQAVWRIASKEKACFSLYNNIGSYIIMVCR